MARKCPKSARKEASRAYKSCASRGESASVCKREAHGAYTAECRGELPYGKIILGTGILAAGAYIFYKVKNQGWVQE